MPENVTTKADLLAAIERNWNELQAFIRYTSDQQFTGPTDAAGWTIADHLLHLSDWEKGMTAVLRGEDRPAAMGLERSLWESDDYDAMNAVMRLHHTGIRESRESVLAYMNESHAALLVALDAVSDANLNKRYGDWQPLDDSDRSLITFFADNTFAHYVEHLPWMRAIGDQVDEADLPPPTTSELIARTKAGWNDLQTFIESLTEAQRTIPTDAAGWTVNDHLLHLADWENGVVALAQGKPRYEAMGVPLDVWENGDDDAINALMRSRYGDKRGSCTLVDQRLQTVHDALMVEIGKFSDADVRTPMNKWHPPENGDYAVAYKFSGNTFLHYEEHIPWMRAIAEQA